MIISILTQCLKYKKKHNTDITYYIHQRIQNIFTGVPYYLHI